MTDTNDIEQAYFQNGEWHAPLPPLDELAMLEAETITNEIMPLLDIQGKKKLCELVALFKIKAVINEQDEQNKAA